jgi:hypothetical protein
MFHWFLLVVRSTTSVKLEIRFENEIYPTDGVNVLNRIRCEKNSHRMVEGMLRGGGDCD